METIWAPNLEQLEKYNFLKVKSATEFDLWKRTCSRWVLLMLSFMFTRQFKTLPQSLICTEEISLYTVHIKSIITKFCFWSEWPSTEHYMCWNISWPASADSLTKTWLFLSLKFYPSHCGTLLHQVPIFYFTAKCLGSLKNIFGHSS